jgi:hypothetical protein
VEGDEIIRVLEKGVAALQGHPVEIVIIRPAQVPAVGSGGGGELSRAGLPQSLDSQVTGLGVADGSGSGERTEDRGGVPEERRRPRRWTRLEKRRPALVDGGGLALTASTLASATVVHGSPQQILIGVGGALAATMFARLSERLSRRSEER